jgi:hypothetical protein
MGKMTEYLESAVGYDSNGLPASTTQFAFGYAPFQVAETENIANLTTVSAICQCDAVVDIKVIDGVAMVSFDFSNETAVFAEFIDELESYTAQKDHVTESLNSLMADLANAERNEDESAIDYITAQVRSMSIPFMLPTILPVIHGGEVQVGFSEDPLFVFFTSDRVNQMPYKVTMIFDAHSLFCQDDVSIYTEDTEAEIRAQQEEMWYMDEARKLEEAEYQAQFGYNADMYDDDDDDQTDKRLKGARFK